jgi:hypothetical protein
MPFSAMGTPSPVHDSCSLILCSFQRVPRDGFRFFVLSSDPQLGIDDGRVLLQGSFKIVVRTTPQYISDPFAAREKGASPAPRHVAASRSLPRTP